MQAVIMLPTYNERDNLRHVVAELNSLHLPNVSYLIIDDNSPDGTGQVADELAEKYDHITVLHRKKKEGLGRAYVEGFHHAITTMNADAIFCMDADLSHDPKKIPEFLDRIQTADVVIGSRYTKGGKIENWNFFRKLVSAGGNLYARTILGMPIRDLTTGYICFKKQVIETIGIDSLAANGYVILIELKYRSFKHGFTIVEIPITFTERREGASKFNLNIFNEAFVSIWRLRFSKNYVKQKPT